MKKKVLDITEANLQAGVNAEVKKVSAKTIKTHWAWWFPSSGSITRFVDFQKKQIKIQRTYIKGPDGDYILRDEMKTEASRRTLDYPGYILDKLAAYPGSHHGRIFRMHPNTIYKTTKRTYEQNEIYFVGVHGFRHTNATVMLSLVVMDKVAMARGGWSTDITMKQVYHHLFASDKETAGKKIDDFFEQLSMGINPKDSTP